MGNPVLRVADLRKVYGSKIAVDGVTFEVGRGFGSSQTRGFYRLPVE